MRWVEVAGYIASSLVFLTFYMRRMVPLRLVSLCSNVAFLTYAFALHLAPIAILHGALIPVNIVRLIGALRERADKPHSGNHLRQNVGNSLSVAPPEVRVMPKTLRDAGLARTDAPGCRAADNGRSGEVRTARRQDSARLEARRGHDVV